MTCFVSITGGIAYHPANTEDVERIVAWGVVDDCPSLTAKVTIGGTEFEAAATMPTTGGWAASVDVSGSGLRCEPGMDIELRVSCDQDPTCGDSLAIKHDLCQTEGSCPVWEKFGALVIDSSDAGCLNGMRTVRLEATLPATVPTGLGSVFVQFCVRSLDGTYSDDLQGIVAQPGVPFFSQTQLAGGSYIYELKVLSPTPCEGPTGIIVVPDCPAPPDDGDPLICPNRLMGEITVGENCTASQQRIVTASATVTPEPMSPVSARLVIFQGDTLIAVLDEGDDLTAETVLSGSLPMDAGTYEIGVEVTSPTYCNFAGETLEVPECGPVPPTCPQVQMRDVAVSDCDDSGQRTITASAMLTPAENTQASAVLVVKENDTIVAELDAAENATTPSDLGGSVTLPAGTYTLELDVTTPPECRGTSRTFTVEPCEDTPPPPPTEFVIPWCLIALIAAIALLVVGSIVTGVAFCALGYAAANPVALTICIVALVIGLIILILGNILFVIWLLTCGSCRLNCDYLNWLVFILGVIGAIWGVLSLVAGIIVASLNGGLFCFIGWGIDAVNFAVLTLLVMYWRWVAGCDNYPAGWPNWLRLTLPDFLTRLCRR